MGSIDSRLRRLEESGDSCPECGPKPEQMLAYYPERGESVPEVPTCPNCGRPLAVVLRVVRDGVPDDMEGGGLT